MGEKFKDKPINRKIMKRDDCFYWQTDRDVNPKEAGKIWSDRHEYFTDKQIIEAVNMELKEDRLISLEPLDYEAQTSLGSVNSVRIGRLNSGKEVIIRNHPTGIENGYFYAESLASSIAKKKGVPSYDTLAIHDLQNTRDHSFQVIEKLPGEAIKNYLEKNPSEEGDILFEVGKTMAKLHQVEVVGFGPFDNQLARQGRLQGLHKKYDNAISAGLNFNLNVLEKENLLTLPQSEKIKELFQGNILLENIQPVLVHNDFADWNLLTDSKKVTGVLDFDECVAGDPISDIACWSTFFMPERLDLMLKGYWSVAEEPEDFEEKFQLFRLRYIISKMTLRIRRYSWDPSEFMEGMIKKGTKHLNDSLEYFDLKSDSN